MRVVVNTAEERIVLRSLDEYERWLADDGQRQHHTVATLAVVNPEAEVRQLTLLPHEAR